MPVSYKKLSWTLKVDGTDSLKFPDIKSATPFLGSFDLAPVTVSKVDPQSGNPPNAQPTWIKFDYPEIPDGFPIVAVILKVDPDSLARVKDPNFTLYVNVVDKDEMPQGIPRQMSVDDAKNGMVFIDALKDYPPPGDKKSKILIENTYPVDLTILVTVVLGTKTAAATTAKGTPTPATQGKQPTPPTPSQQNSQTYQGEKAD